ncbi:MAG: DMT family transporter [Syntrophobacteraceae bacterium]
MHTSLPHAADHHPRPTVLWTAVLIGILAISSASVLIRIADAPPLSIAAYRVTLASLILACFRLSPKKTAPLHYTGAALAATGLSGLFLAFHFAAWITSLTMTSIASSVTLVSTTPLFVTLIAWLFLNERFRPRFLAGILLTLVGSGAIAGLDSRLSATAVRGDLLALLGAVMAAGYFVSGRIARESLSLSDYALGSYGTASLTLISLCLLTGQELAGFSGKTYTALFFLALVPQLIGHTTFNWTLKFLSPATVSVLILGEPIGATILGHILLREDIDASKAMGLAVLGAGIFLCALCAPGHSDSPRSSTSQPAVRTGSKLKRPAR